MLRTFTSSGTPVVLRRVLNPYQEERRWYPGRRRRSGDGRMRDIFEEKAAANKEEYFRKETARLIRELRDRLKSKSEKKAPSEEHMHPDDEIKKKGAHKDSIADNIILLEYA